MVQQSNKDVEVMNDTMVKIVSNMYKILFEGHPVTFQVTEDIKRIHLFNEYRKKQKEKESRVAFPDDIKFFFCNDTDGKPVITVATKINDQVGSTVVVDYGVAYCSREDEANKYEGMLEAYKRIHTGGIRNVHSGRTFVKKSSMSDNLVLFTVIDNIFRTNTTPRHLMFNLKNWLIETINSQYKIRKNR